MPEAIDILWIIVSPMSTLGISTRVRCERYNVPRLLHVSNLGLPFVAGSTEKGVVRVPRSRNQTLSKNVGRVCFL